MDKRSVTTASITLEQVENLVVIQCNLIILRLKANRLIKQRNYGQA